MLYRIRKASDTSTSPKQMVVVEINRKNARYLSGELFDRSSIVLQKVSLRSCKAIKVFLFLK